jgi:hypothetical protein
MEASDTGPIEGDYRFDHAEPFGGNPESPAPGIDPGASRVPGGGLI